MKKVLFLPVILLIIILLSGCGSGSFIGSFQYSTSRKMSASYMYFSGSKRTTLTVKEGTPVEISVDIETKKGNLDATIYNEDGEYSYEGRALETDTFTVTLSKPGKYTIEVVADKHKGSYKFTW